MRGSKKAIRIFCSGGTLSDYTIQETSGCEIKVAVIFIDIDPTLYLVMLCYKCVCVRVPVLSLTSFGRSKSVRRSFRFHILKRRIVAITFQYFGPLQTARVAMALK